MGPWEGSRNDHRSDARASGCGTLPMGWQPRRHVIGGLRPVRAENIAYRAYGAGHDQTARQVRRHRPSRQGRWPFPRPGGLRGRSQPGSIQHERKRHQRAHGRGDHLRCRRRRARPGRWRLPSPRPSSPARSRLRIRSGHPAGERPVPAVVRRFEEHRLPELVVAAGARDPDVSHTATTPGRLPGRLAEARCPAHLRSAGPQLVTERTGFRLVLEQRSGHLNDHARDQLPRVNDHRDVHGRSCWSSSGGPRTWPGWLVP